MENPNLGVGVYELLLVSLILVAAAWSLAWKGVALWHAARDGRKGWFVALLLVNTLGLLEILYLFVLRRPAGPVAGGPGPSGLG